MAYESFQYLDNHESQCFDFCIECKLTDGTCQLYYHQVRKMIIYEDTNILVSHAFIKCFSIFLTYKSLSFSVSIIIFLIRHFFVISSIGSVIEPMTSQNGGQDGRHGFKMAAMTSRSR